MEKFRILLKKTDKGRTGTVKMFDLSLNVNSSNASRLLLHLLHPFVSQVEVGLQVVPYQAQPQSTQRHDDPQAHAVKCGTGHSAKWIISGKRAALVPVGTRVHSQSDRSLSHRCVCQKVSSDRLHPQDQNHDWRQETHVQQDPIGTDRHW